MLGARKPNYQRRLEWFRFGTWGRETQHCFDGEQLLDYCVALLHKISALNISSNVVDSKVTKMFA